MNRTTGPRKTRRTLAALGALVAAGTLRADALDNLVKRSPFVPETTGRETTRIEAPSRVEFGGYLETDGEPRVSLTDTATGRSVWVALRDANAAYYVETLDTDTPAVALRLNGRSVTLALRKTADAPGAPAQPAPEAKPAEATILNPGAKAPGEPEPEAPATPAPANRIPPQRLRVPRRVDDPA